MTAKEAIDLVRAEVERCIALKESRITNKRLKELLSFLDTIPVEEPKPEVDLEKEISDTCRSYRIRGDFDGTELNKHDIENIGRYFYELGCRHAAVLYDDIEFERQRRQENEPTIKGWVARDKDGELSFFSMLPKRFDEVRKWFVMGACIVCNFGFNKSFPELKWEDEPVEVELTLNRV